MADENQPVEEIKDKELAAKKECFVFANGDQYEGEYKRDGNTGIIEKSGKGKYTCHDGTVYEGTWESDKLTGPGSATFADCTKYTGCFNGHHFHGYGRYCWPDGSYLEGVFLNNKIQGAGRYVDAYGQEWHGYFKGRRAEGLQFHLNICK